MSDELLRHLARASAASGDPATEARLLLHRVRQGELAHERLELAAWVGHEAARLALEGEGWRAPSGEFVEWFVGIARFGRDAALRAALGAARRFSLTRERNGNEIDSVYLALERVDAWFLVPGEPTAQALERAYREAMESPHYGGGIDALWMCGLILTPDSFDETFQQLAEHGANHRGVHVRDLQRWVAGEVVPWALGLEDPVALRSRREGKRFSTEGDMIRSLGFSPSGRSVLVGARLGNVRVRAFPSGELVRELPRQPRDVFAAVFSPDEATIATGDQDGALKLWDAATGNELRSIEATDDQIRGVVFLGEGSLVAWGGTKGHAQILELATGKVVAELRGHERTISGLAVSPSGELLATASQDHTTRIWDARTGEHRRTLAHEQGLEDVAWLPDGRRLVTSGDSGEVVLWDATSGEKLRAFEGCEGTVYALAVSPRGDLVAACGSMGPLHLWEASTGAVVRTGLWFSQIFALAFSRDGRVLLSGERGGGVRLFELD